jgi:hypothetical protein
MSESAPAWFAEMVLPAWRDDVAVSISPDREPDPIEIDPRPCDWCGLTIDRHQMVDNGEGPEFFCPDLSPDEMTLPELERRAELRRQEDVAAIVAAMPDCPPLAPRAAPEPYRPAQPTIDAFRLVVATGDVGRLKAWLADRPKDAPLLLALLESPPC